METYTDLEPVALGDKQPPLPITLEKKQEFIRYVKNEILEGNLNPLEAYRQFKIITDCIEELKKDSEVFDCAYSEIQKYGKEKPKINDAIVTASSRTNYNYASCNDSVYNELKEKIKAREAYLKALPVQGAVDPETGELVLPPTTSETSYITVTLK